CQQYTGSPPTF
nr:immunoglobulin light chain junction region [Macaca mulatta]MOV35368.1 immunoglobulin light chain junction region [Macaca mulatta]